MSEIEPQPARELERVWLLVTRGRFIEAEHAARRVLTQWSEDSWALRLLSIALMEQGRADEALESARASCRVEPGEPMNWIHLSQLHEQRDEIPAAIQAAGQAVRSGPHFAISHARLASANVARTDPNDERSCSDAAAALRAAEEAIRLDPSVSRFHTTRGVALSRLGRPQDAQAAYRRTLQLQPNSPGALNNLAWLDIRRRPISAARILARSLQIRPGWRHPRENLAMSMETWVLRMIWIVLAGGAALTATHSLPTSLRALILAGVGLICVTGSAMLHRALPRRSFRALWGIYPQRIGSSSLRLIAVSAIAVLLAFASGPLWWFAVVVWMAQVAIEWQSGYLGFEGSLRPRYLRR